MRFAKLAFRASERSVLVSLAGTGSFDARLLAVAWSKVSIAAISPLKMVTYLGTPPVFTDSRGVVL